MKTSLMHAMNAPDRWPSENLNGGEKNLINVSFANMTTLANMVTLMELCDHFQVDKLPFMKFINDVTHLGFADVTFPHRTLVDFFRSRDGKEPNKPLSEEYLVQLGFVSTSTKMKELLKRSREESDKMHMSGFQFVERFIRDELVYNATIAESHRTTWWEKLHPEKLFRHVNRVRDLSFSEDRSYLYHGTDIKSALCIVHDGIQLCYGRKASDFGVGHGFYLSFDFDQAQRWASATTRKSAVVVFECNLDNWKLLDLRANEKTEEWKRIVRSYRNGSRTKQTRVGLSNRGIDAIIGPMAKRLANGELEPIPESVQLCVISETKATLLRSCFIEIVSEVIGDN